MFPDRTVFDQLPIQTSLLRKVDPVVKSQRRRMENNFYLESELNKHIDRVIINRRFSSFKCLYARIGLTLQTFQPTSPEGIKSGWEDKSKMSSTETEVAGSAKYWNIIISLEITTVIGI